MSGVYIPGIKMPKNCKDCNFYENDGVPWCCIARRSTDEISCPLVSVPDHGRLIDADFAIENRNKDMNWCYDLCDLPDYLNGLPTIVPADKENK